MNIYSFCDMDFIAAETEEDAIDFYKKMFEIFDEEIDVTKLSEEQLNTYIFYFEEGDREDNILHMPFKQHLEELIKQEAKFPLFFASTEY